jgi:hypothetical protein
LRVGPTTHVGLFFFWKLVFVTEPSKLWWPTCTCHYHNDLRQP